MDRKIRFGILSTSAFAAHRIIPAMRTVRNAEFTAVASRDLNKAQVYAEANGIPRAFGSYEELLADADIDAIYNPLPPALHAPWSIHCAEVGLPVLCEKPLAPTAVEARQMVTAFSERNLLFAEALMYRHHPVTLKVKELLNVGIVGDIHTLRATFTVRINRTDDIRFKKATGGGALLDVGSYCVSAIRTMMGEEPINVQGHGKFNGDDVDVWMTGSMRFSGGACAYFGCSLVSEFENSYEITGSAGKMLVQPGTAFRSDETGIIRLWQHDQYSEIKIDPVDHYKLMIEDFADALLTGRKPFLDPQDGIRNLEVIDRLTASAHNH